MKKLLKQYIKNKNGITLLALVITIIILLILSGVAISALGESGLIAKAKEQKVIQTKAEILEQLEMQKTSVLNYDTLYTDLGEYIKHIQKENLGGHKVTDVIEKDKANAEIVVDGEYVYKVAQIGNNVVINAEGYIEELDPQIDSFIVKNKNTSKIEVEAKVRRAEKYEFWILKNDKWEKSGTEKTEKMDSNAQKTITYEYTGLTSLEQGQKYQLKIVAKRGNNRQVEKIIDSEIKNVEIAEGNLIFDIQPTEWTNKEITTKIYKKTDEEGKILENLENLTIQYQINVTAETLTDNSKWIEYTKPIVTDKNIVIWVRLWDGFNAGSVATRTITKIDSKAPIVKTELQYVSQTVNSTTVKLKAIDTESGISTIKWYYKTSSQSSYNEPQKDTYVEEINGTNTGVKTEQEKSHVFSSLSCGTTYNIYAEVYDVAGNMTRTPSTGSIDVMINHVYGTKTTTSAYLKSNATCTEVAVYYYKCDGCSKKGTTTYTNGDILGHNFTSSQNGTKKSDATCTEPATYYDKCTRCGANATTYHNSGSALGHTGNEGGTITQYTSCTADGWRWYRCTRCHQDYSGTYKYENAWGHSMGAFYSVSYDKYNHHRVCSRCSYEETAEHSFRFGYPNGRTSNGAYMYCACDNHYWGVRFNTTYPGNSEFWAQFNYDHQTESASPSRDFGNRGIEDWWY